MAGAGIRNNGALTISHSTVRDSTGSVVNRGTLTVSRSALLNNFTGIKNRRKGTVTVVRSTLRRNAPGGGITNFGALTVSRSTLARNRDRSRSGAIENGGAATVIRSTLRGNRGEIGGAAANWGRDSTLSIRQSTLVENRAAGVDGVGGAIFNDGIVSISRSTLAANYAFESGSAIAVNGGHGHPTAIRQSTLSGNRVRFSSGGQISGEVSLESTIVANSPKGGNCALPVTSLGHNLSDDSTCSLTSQGDQPSTNPRLMPLGDYGGPTKTLALRPTSPAIDAGFADNFTTDQRGFPRIVDYPGVPKPAGGDNSDIGAFELQAPTP